MTLLQSMRYNYFVQCVRVALCVQQYLLVLNGLIYSNPIFHKIILSSYLEPGDILPGLNGAFATAVLSYANETLSKRCN